MYVLADKEGNAYFSYWMQKGVTNTLNLTGLR